MFKCINVQKMSFLLGFLFLLFVGGISAVVNGSLNLDSESVLSVVDFSMYSLDNKTISLNSDVEVKLVSPLHNYVEAGEEVMVMQMDIVNVGLVSFKDFFGKVKVKNMHTGLMEEKEVWWKYAVYGDVKVDDWDLTCDDVWSEVNKTFQTECVYEVVGNHLESQIVSWEDVTDSGLPKSELTFGLFTNVKQGDYYDGIPTFDGLAVTRWATWDAIVMDYVGATDLDATAVSTFKAGTWVRIKNGTTRIVSFETSASATMTNCYIQDYSSGGPAETNRPLYRGSFASDNCTFATPTSFVNNTLLLLFLNGSGNYGRKDTFTFPVAGTNLDFIYGAEYPAANYTNKAMNIIRIYSQVVATSVAMLGFVLDGANNPLEDMNVLIIRQLDNILVANLTTNSTGGWSYEADLGYNYTVSAYDPLNKSRYGDIKPFVEVN